MKSMWIMLLVIGWLYTSDCSCPKRDESAAKREDSTRKCRKSCKNTSDCKGSSKKCLCDDLCGLSCYNPDSQCSNITGTLGNGTIFYQKKQDPLKYGSKALHQCNEGWFLQGEEARICRSDKKWSSNPSQCVRGCSVPGRIDVSYPVSIYQKKGYLPGETVVYKCRSGYTRNGNDTVTCLPSYTWSTLKMQCNIVNCGPPPPILNGIYVSNNAAGVTAFGTIITYKCNNGFYTTSPSTTTLCSASGDWYRSAPDCQRVACPPPLDVSNGKLESSGNSFVFEDSVMYRCDKGYLIDKSKSKVISTCTENSTWSAQPSCEADLNADFDTDMEGYSGSYSRVYYSPPSGLPGFGLQGSGVVRSVPYPLSSGERLCLRVDAKDGPLTAQARSGAKIIDLRKIRAGSEWKSHLFWFLSPISGQSQVELQFTSSQSSWIDNVKVLENKDCNNEIVPRLLPTTMTSTISSTTTTTGLSSEPAESTSVRAATTSTSTTTTTSTIITTTTNAETTNPASSSPNVVAYVLVGVAILVVLLAAVALWYWRERLSRSCRKTEKPEPAELEPMKA